MRILQVTIHDGNSVTTIVVMPESARGFANLGLIQFEQYFNNTTAASSLMLLGNTTSTDPFLYMYVNSKITTQNTGSFFVLVFFFTQRMSSFKLSLKQLPSGRKSNVYQLSQAGGPETVNYRILAIYRLKCI